MNDKTCAIRINNPLGFELDKVMLGAVLAKCAQYASEPYLISIHATERIPDDAPAYRNPGWIEWSMVLTHEGRQRLVIGAIQRSLGCEVEFHT